MFKVKGCGPNIFILAGGVVQSFDRSKAEKSIRLCRGPYTYKGFCGDVIRVPSEFFIRFISILS